MRWDFISLNLPQSTTSGRASNSQGELDSPCQLKGPTLTTVRENLLAFQTSFSLPTTPERDSLSSWIPNKTFFLLKEWSGLVASGHPHLH